jgi:hypothetical protein
MGAFSGSEADTATHDGLVLNFELDTDTNVMAQVSKVQVAWVQGNLAKIIEAVKTNGAPEGCGKTPLCNRMRLLARNR